MNVLAAFSSMAGVGNVLPRTKVGVPRVSQSGKTWNEVRPSFKKVKELGHGAFGKAFSALRGRSKVIIKVVSPMKGVVSLPEAYAALAREAAILVDLQRLPFIPRMVEVGKDYFIQEDVGGESMLNILSKEGLSAFEILAVTVAVGIMISMIHKEGYAHRDLEPRNILLTPSGTVIIDFGIAVSKEENEKAYRNGIRRDLISLLEDVTLAASSRDLTEGERAALASIIEDFRKKVIQGSVNEYTGKELAERLLFVLAQLGSRAKRGGKMKPRKVKVLAV